MMDGLKRSKRGEDLPLPVLLLSPQHSSFSSHDIKADLTITITQIVSHGSRKSSLATAEKIALPSSSVSPDRPARHPTSLSLQSGPGSRFSSDFSYRCSLSRQSLTIPRQDPTVCQVRIQPSPVSKLKPVQVFTPIQISTGSSPSQNLGIFKNV